MAPRADDHPQRGPDRHLHPSGAGGSRAARSPGEAQIGYDRQLAAQYASAAWRRELTIIPNGVPTDIFTPPAPVEAAPHDRPVKLLFVGRIGDERKGARFLFEAYRALIARKLPVTLDVVGALGDARAPPALRG